MVFRSLLRRKFNEETLMRLGNEWYIAFVFEQSTDKIVDIHDSVPLIFDRYWPDYDIAYIDSSSVFER